MPNSLYLVTIEVKYDRPEGQTNEVKKFYRWLYTNQCFNDYYYKEEDYKKQLQEKEDNIKSLKISNYDYFCKLSQQNKVVDNIDDTDDKEDKEEFETLDDLLKEEFK